MQSQQERLKQMADKLAERFGEDDQFVKELRRQIASGQPRPHSPNPIGEDKR